ncbi:MAG: alpha/beta hydrolase fold domain-containing protein, partial [Acidimicrobiales bacterium]
TEHVVPGDPEIPLRVHRPKPADGVLPCVYSMHGGGYVIGTYSAMLDDRQITLSSRRDGLPVWSRESNAFGWRSYLGGRYGRDDVPYTAAPARATDLSGLPPAFVSVGALDGFRDEDIDYAARLNDAGVPTELHVYPGACHGYQIAQDAAVTRQSRRDAEQWLSRQLSR